MEREDFSTLPYQHPVRTMWNYYSTLPRNTCLKVPLWLDFDPMQVPTVLQWVTVIKRQDSTLEGHVQSLMGEGMKGLMGGDYTGKNLATILKGKFIAQHWGDLIHVAKCREPSLFKTHIPVQGRDFFSVLRGNFPFCDESDKISHFIIVAAKTLEDDLSDSLPRHSKTWKGDGLDDGTD